MNKKAKTFGGWFTFLLFAAIIIFLILLTKNDGNITKVIEEVQFWR